MIYMELRCEDRSEPYADVEIRGERCWSHDNYGCAQFASDTLSDGFIGIQQLFVEATECGWEQIKDHGWVCPHCISHRNGDV